MFSDIQFIPFEDYLEKSFKRIDELNSEFNGQHEKVFDLLSNNDKQYYEILDYLISKDINYISVIPKATLIANNCEIFKKLVEKYSTMFYTQLWSDTFNYECGYCKINNYVNPFAASYPVILYGTSGYYVQKHDNEHGNYCKLISCALETNGLTLKELPEKYQTKKYIEKAIKQNGLAIQYVKKELQCLLSMHKIALKQNCLALKFIISEYEQNDEIMYEACVKFINQK
jgi:hypothetical protein